MKIPDDNSGLPHLHGPRRHTQPAFFVGEITHRDQLDALVARLDFELFLQQCTGMEVLILERWRQGREPVHIASELKVRVALVKDFLGRMQAALRLDS